MKIITVKAGKNNFLIENFSRTNTIKRMIQNITNWPMISLIYAICLLLFILLLVELSLSIFIHRTKKKNKENEKIDFTLHSLFIFRVFFRFEIVYLFLKIIEIPDGAAYPWNLLYEIPASAIFYSGLIIPVYMLINLFISQYNNQHLEDALENKLRSISSKSLKRIFFFLVLSLLLSKTLKLLPLELRNSFLVRSILISNGILFTGIILLTVQKSFKSARKLFDEKIEKSRISILIYSLSVPLQLIILSLSLYWIESLMVDMPLFSNIINKSQSFLVLAALLVFTFRIVEILGSRLSRMSDSETNPLDKTLVEMMRMIVRIALIFIGAFGVIQIVTGKPLTTLLAGLGIGGLALALAAQDTLKNFFGSLMIMTDKPFKIGERVKGKDFDGTIEAIGFRSTRIRTLVGHQVIIPNEQMASNPIENIGKRPYIRRLTNITVTYGTSPDKMEKALSIIKNILENHEGMDPEFPPRVFFNDLNTDSLNILMLYWYFPPDYWMYMAFTEYVNLRIMKEFNQEGIEFAFPTTTTYLEQSEGQKILFQMEKDSIDD